MIKLLHLADLHIGMENYGRLDPATGLHTRLLDYLARLDEAIDLGLSQGVDMVLIAGDIYKNRTPNPTHQREFARRIRRLRQAGLPTQHIDAPAADAAQFDSEALWQVVAPQIGPGDRVLIVRGGTTPGAEGGSGREWLSRQIAAAGGTVDFVSAYERGAPQFDADQQALARQAATDGSVWLLSSSEAVAHLAAALPGQHWGQARALATHPRIAQAAQAAGFGSVNECRPAFNEVAASIESLHEH